MGEKRGRHEREGKGDECWLRDDGQVERRVQELARGRSQAREGTGVQVFLDCAGCFIPLQF